MKLGSVSVWFPVLRLEAEVNYRLLPELTPLHRTLETAVKQFSNSKNILATVPISELFRLLFGVSGAREILPDVLEDLIERGRIHRILEDERDSSQIRILDLAPGRREGERVVEATSPEIDKQASQTRKIERFFDPVLEEVVDAKNLSPKPKHENCLCVPSDPFLPNPPKHWVEDELRRELDDDVQLYSVDCQLIAHEWRLSKGELVLKNGELSVECENIRQSEYIRGLSQSVRRTWLLPGILEGSWGSVEEDAGEFSIYCQLPSSISGLALTRGLPEAVRTQLSLPANVVLIELDSAADINEPMVIPSSGKERAWHVAYPRNDNPSMEGIFLATEGREYRRLPVTWEGLHVEIGVFNNAPGFQEDSSIWSDVIATLETECRFSSSPEVFVLPAFWLDPEIFWLKLSERSANEPDAQAWVKKIAEVLSRLPSAVLDQMEASYFRIRPTEHLHQHREQLDCLFPSALAQFENSFSKAESFSHVPQSCQRVIAFDTSSFIKYDRLIESLLPSDFLVAPQVVAAEIERKKSQNDDFRIISRRNLRAIDMLPKERWAAPFHDFSFLASGDKKNNDGAIIATLIPYCKRGLEVFVVSEDHDFLLRGRPYGIKWMNAETFLQSSRKAKGRDR